STGDGREGQKLALLRRATRRMRLLVSRRARKVCEGRTSGSDRLCVLARPGPQDLRAKSDARERGGNLEEERRRRRTILCLRGREAQKSRLAALGNIEIPLHQVPGLKQPRDGWLSEVAVGARVAPVNRSHRVERLAAPMEHPAFFIGGASLPLSSRRFAITFR